MKRLITILCALALLLSFAACGQSQDNYVPTGDALHSDGTTQPTGTTAQPQVQQLRLAYTPSASMNPYQTSNYTNRILFPLLYQGLFSVDADYQVVPILCKSFSVSKDLKTYTFHLEAATFSDGTALTAADVLASLNAARKSRVYQGRLSYVTNISVTPDGAVVIQLGTAYENLPLLLDIPIVKAADVNAQRPIGSGPYYLEERVTGLRLVRRTDWWCRADLTVTAEQIPLVEATSSAQIRDAYEFGKVDLVCTDPGSDDYVDFRSDYELWSSENGIFMYLACNEKSPVFSDKAMRQALTHVINRELLVENHYRSFATAAYLPASPDSPYYSRSLAAKYGYNPSIFANLVAEKFPQPDPEDPNAPSTVTVTILVNKGEYSRVRVARTIAAMLTNCGLKAVTSELAGQDYTKALTKGKYDLHLGQTVLSQNMDLSAFYASAGSLCYGGLSDAVILAMCQEALANSGNYYTLHKMVMEDGMLCPILFRSYAVYTARGLFATLPAARDNMFFYSLGKTMKDVYRPD